MFQLSLLEIKSTLETHQVAVEKFILTNVKELILLSRLEQIFHWERPACRNVGQYCRKHDTNICPKNLIKPFKNAQLWQEKVLRLFLTKLSDPFYVPDLKKHILKTQMNISVFANKWKNQALDFSTNEIKASTDLRDLQAFALLTF